MAKMKQLFSDYIKEFIDIKYYLNKNIDEMAYFVRQTALQYNGYLFVYY